MKSTTIAERPFQLVNFAFVLVFIYFLTMSMDLISIDVFFFKLKLSHGVAMTMALFLTCCRGLIVPDKLLLICFALMVSSVFISSFFSIVFLRSFIYTFVCAINCIVYLLVPISLIFYFDEKKIIKLYFLSFYCIGMYAALQFFASLIGCELPFSVQKVIYIRGSAMAHEPSFYALFAIPFVSFVNSRYLLSLSGQQRNPNLSMVNVRQFEGLLPVILANLFLLVSTTTTAFISYFVFFFVILVVSRLSAAKAFFHGLKKRLLKMTLFIGSLFLLGIFSFPDMFRKTFLKFFYYGFDHESFNDRLSGILSALQTFLANPAFGVGIGGIGPLLYSRDTCLNPHMKTFDRYEIERLEPTNVITEILGCLGIYGFLAFGMFVFLVIFRLKKALGSKKLDEEQTITLLSFLISSVVMLICLQVNQGLFRGYVWVHLGMALGYVYKLRASSKTDFN